MPLKKLMEFLDKNGVKYISIRHSPAYTAQEIAGAAHIKGQNVAKTVMVRIDGELAMAVLPAQCRVDLDKLKQARNAQSAEIAKEADFTQLFPDCEPGAMPPFGNLYDLPVWVDTTLIGDDKIAFNAGTHSDLVQMTYKDFERLVKPEVIDFCRVAA
jgi:Ala-tRNA(Pro) deacylase